VPGRFAPIRAAPRVALFGISLKWLLGQSVLIAWLHCSPSVPATCIDCATEYQICLGRHVLFEDREGDREAMKKLEAAIVAA
jgi:hypothetical protein